LVTELAYPTHRAKLTTMYNVCWYLGSIVAAWTVYGTVNYTTNSAWRIPVALQALMPVIQLVLIFMAPESPRWYISKNKHDQALNVLRTYHSNGGEVGEMIVEWGYQGIYETIKQEQLAKRNSWLVFVQTPDNRKRLILITLTGYFSQCSGNGLVSYYIHDILSSIGITASNDQAIINAGLQIWSFLVALVFAFTVDKFGRKPLFVTAAVGMLISFTIWTACSAVYAQTQNAGAGRTVIAMIFTFYMVAGLAWPGLTVAYVAELLPFDIRAKGVAYGNLIVALSSVFN
jgi:MFS family permease